MDVNNAVHGQRTVKRAARAIYSCSSCRASKMKCDRGDKQDGEACTPCQMRGKDCFLQGAAPSRPSARASLPVCSTEKRPSLPKRVKTEHILTKGEQSQAILERLEEIKSMLVCGETQGSFPDSTDEEYLQDNTELPFHGTAKGILVGAEGVTKETQKNVSCHIDLQHVLIILPTKSTTDRLLQSFFDEAQALEQYLDEQNFRSRWARIELARFNTYQMGTHEDAITVSTSFMAIASCLLYLSKSHPSIIALALEIGPSFDALAQSETYMAASRFVSAKAQFEWASAAIGSPLQQSIACLGVPTLNQLELLLIEMYNISSSKTQPEALWKRTAIAVTMALELNLHQKAEPDTQEGDRRVRLFFAVFLLDKYASFIVLKPPLLAWNSHKVPLPYCSASAPETERSLEARARYSKILTAWASHQGAPLPLNTIRSLLYELDAWHGRCRELGLVAATHMQLTTAVLNGNDLAVRMLGRRQLALAAQYSHMTMLLCRDLMYSEDKTRSTAPECERALQAAQDTVSLCSMIVSVWRLLAAPQREVVPLNLTLSWISFTVFDCVLMLMWALAGMDAGGEGDNLFSLVIQGRDMYKFSGEHGIILGNRAAAIIDALLPSVTLLRSGTKTVKEHRQELAGLLRAALNSVPFNSLTTQDTNTGIPLDMLLPPDLAWPVFDGNWELLGMDDFPVS